jgi:hypothetical protein
VARKRKPIWVGNAVPDDESDILSPGNTYTFNWPPSFGWPNGASIFEADIRLPPIAVYDIMERLLEIQKAGRTPKRVFVRRDLWKHLHRITGHWQRSQWPRGGAKHYILGVRVAYTSGKLPFYVVDDKGNKL